RPLVAAARLERPALAAEDRQRQPVGRRAAVPILAGGLAEPVDRQRRLLPDLLAEADVDGVPRRHLLQQRVPEGDLAVGAGEDAVVEALKGAELRLEALIVQPVRQPTGTVEDEAVLVRPR